MRRGSISIICHSDHQSEKSRWSQGLKNFQHHEKQSQPHEGQTKKWIIYFIVSTRLLSVLPTNCLSVFDHFLKLALKWLKKIHLSDVKYRYFFIYNFFEKGGVASFILSDSLIRLLFYTFKCLIFVLYAYVID